MKKNLLLFFGIFLSFVLTAQPKDNTPPKIKNSKSAESNKTMNVYLQSSSPGRLYTFQKGLPDVDGSPYLYDDLVYGDIETIDGQVISNLLYRYNTHEDRLEYNKDGKLINLFPYKIRKFSFFDQEAGKTRSFRNGFQNYLDNYTALSYYEVLYDGKVKLLKKHDKPVMRVGSKIGAPGINTNTATKRYSNLNRYYIQRGERFIFVKLSKLAVMDAMPSGKLRKYLKDTKNKCRTVEDVVKAIQFYETLNK